MNEVPAANGVAGWFRRTFFTLAPSSGEALHSLDGLRALAVIGIFARHAWGLSGAPSIVIEIPGGNDLDLSPMVVMLSNGVDLFFVLSGFLLARSFIAADLHGDPRPPLRRYFRLRAFRILPAFYLVLAVLLVFFVPTMIPSDLVYSAAGLKSILSHVVMLQTVFPWSYGIWGPASPFWTLTIEIIFYAAVPWLSWFFFRNRWRWALPLSAMVSFGWLWFARSSLATPFVDAIVDHGGRTGAGPAFARFFLSKQFPAHLFAFAVGMAVASVYVQYRAGRSGPLVRALSTARGSLACMLLGGALVLGAMRALGVITLTNRYYDGIILMESSSRSALAFYYLEQSSMVIGFGLVTLGVVLGPPRSSRLLAISPLRLVGILGYSIYLWHMPFLYQYATMPWINEVPPLQRWFVLMALVGAIVGFLSLMTFAFVERPFIDLGRRGAIRVNGQPTPAVAEPDLTAQDALRSEGGPVTHAASTTSQRT
jgi:peptidoglycan/LPS O-acetylase OafA/YrhL